MNGNESNSRRPWRAEQICTALTLILGFILILAIAAGITLGTMNGNTERRKSIEACVSHNGTWDGLSGSCQVR